MAGVVFVFYRMPDGPPAFWEYGAMPRGWWMVGQGVTRGALPREEQFQGPRETTAEMEAYAHARFGRLVARGTVEVYAVRRSYAPRAAL